MLRQHLLNHIHWKSQDYAVHRDGSKSDDDVCGADLLLENYIQETLPHTASVVTPGLTTMKSPINMIKQNCTPSLVI